MCSDADDAPVGSTTTSDVMRRSRGPGTPRRPASRRDGDRPGGHDVARRAVRRSARARHLAAQVAVGDDAGQARRRRRRRVSCRASCRSSRRARRGAGVRRDARHGVAAVHQRVRPHQPLAERAARVKVGEVLVAEALRRTSSVIASASPRASAAVVLAVGARFSGQASSSTCVSRSTSAVWPSVDCGWPVSPSAWLRCRFIASTTAPLPASRRRTTAQPRRPRRSSRRGRRGGLRPGWRKKAGVPVLASVAATLRQMMPDLPMPVTTTRPRQCSSSCDRARSDGRARPPGRGSAAASV